MHTTLRRIVGMKLAFSRSRPLVAQLSKDKLVVVGGSKRGSADDMILTEIITDRDADKKRLAQ